MCTRTCSSVYVCGPCARTSSAYACAFAWACPGDTVIENKWNRNRLELQEGTVEIHASKFFMLPSLQMNTQATSLGYTKAPASLRPGRSSAPGISPQQRKKIRDRFSWVAVQS